MKRWKIGWLIALAAATLVLLFHSKSPDLLTDSDTAVLLRTIRKVHSPFSWFWSDWPLYNHFYRPIPALLFEIDNRLYGNWADGYAWTNAILGAGCVLALFWLLREILDSLFLACGGTVLFALWQTSFPYPITSTLNIVGWVVLAIGIVRHRRDWRQYIPAYFAIVLLNWTVSPMVNLGPRVIGWLPGRTASSMCLFALLAMAAYSRYERLSTFLGPRRNPSSMDRPATKSSKKELQSGIPRILWATISLVCTVAAFASYEQAVMLPACLLGLAIYFRLTHQRVGWGWQVAFWSILALYLFVRHQVIPPGESAYQAQQMKTSLAGPLNDLASFLFPPLGTMSSLRVEFDEGLYIFLDPNLYANLMIWVVYGAAIYLLRKRWKLTVLGWLLPFVAFAPMAFVKVFEHYYYFPMALRTILVAPIAIVVYDLSLNALSPPVLRAPQRLHPAPGSLPGR